MGAEVSSCGRVLVCGSGTHWQQLGAREPSESRAPIPASQHPHYIPNPAPLSEARKVKEFGSLLECPKCFLSF